MCAMTVPWLLSDVRHESKIHVTHIYESRYSAVTHKYVSHGDPLFLLACMP